MSIVYLVRKKVFRTAEGVKPGWHMNKKYWNSVYFNQDVPDSIIRELVAHSYRLVVESLPKRERECYTPMHSL